MTGELRVERSFPRGSSRPIRSVFDADSTCDAQKAAANESLRVSVEKRGFVIARGTMHECVTPLQRGDCRPIRSKSRRSALRDERADRNDPRTEEAASPLGRARHVCRRKREAARRACQVCQLYFQTGETS